MGRELQQMHEEIMIQDQRTKGVKTWAMVGTVKSSFIDIWLVDKNRGNNYVVISVGYLPCGALCYGFKEACIQQNC